MWDSPPHAINNLPWLWMVKNKPCFSEIGFATLTVNGTYRTYGNSTVGKFWRDMVLLIEIPLGFGWKNHQERAEHHMAVESPRWIPWIPMTPKQQQWGDDRQEQPIFWFLCFRNQHDNTTSMNWWLQFSFGVVLDVSDWQLLNLWEIVIGVAFLSLASVRSLSRPCHGPHFPGELQKGLAGSRSAHHLWNAHMVTHRWWLQGD
jgi:hypothetical protein